jgi:phosphoribosyl 1,2-cyclic phosphodiesterase
VRFASLGSGSRGNGTLVQADATLVLVDCGFSLRETESRLQRLGVSGEDLSAILVTHEHSDHCSGVARLSRKYAIPVHLSRGTWASGRCDGASSVEYFHSEAPFSIGALTVAPIAVPHDAREPCQFVFQANGKTLGVLTDLGSITPAVSAHYRACHGLLLECNHDSQLLREGSYPPHLKKRVGGDWGHLNNHQAAQLLEQLQLDGLQHLAEVYAPVEHIVWADQALGFDWLQLA